ncbi:MAG: hypothetical protein Q7S33_03120 [Nanoarchaeota archaeon]|nr:hypothetical protein [Nanoarchaeota archaeon]
MDIKIVKDEKKELDVQVNSLTLVELLRVYLNKEGADVAAWKREHPTKSPILHIEADNPKKLLQKAITSAQKELDSILEETKKLK